MRRIGSAICWSASDLTAAAECEYRVLREVDRLLGRGQVAPLAEDPLMNQIVGLGHEHEAAELSRLEQELGAYDPAAGTGVRRLPTPEHGTPVEAAERTREALRAGADVLYQAAFHDGEFLGYADFLRRTDDGWVVADSKLARRAKPQALLQLAAYADQLEDLGEPVAPTVELLLGSGERAAYPLAEIAPIFRERRERLRGLLAAHADQDQPVAWGDDRLTFCGTCSECVQAIEAHQDLLLVARMRQDQRRKLRAAGVTTLEELVAAEECPDDLNPAVFEQHRAQARLQLEQRATDRVAHEVRKISAIRQLPVPSPGDVFFDFEGDPLYNDGDLKQWGLEYLWGMVLATDTGEPPFEFFWADDHAEEKQALAAFLALVDERRTAHPDMHVYHYAPYEVSTLKRLVAQHPEHEAALDDLLRAGVFVDLYATVREGVLVSQSSYSIKALEPLYMERPREGDVQGGDVSVAEYQRYRMLRESGRDDEADAAKQALLEYNEYDCVSTLQLRDWLLSLVDSESPEPEGVPEQDEEETPAREPEPLYHQLMAHSGPERVADRTHDEQAWALLAAALDYHRREDRSFWWGHFDRLGSAMESWTGTKDTVCFTGEPKVDVDWHKPPKKHTLSREITAVGQLGVGSTLQRGDKMQAVYADPVPEGCEIPTNGRYAVATKPVVISDLVEEGDDLTVTFTESLKKGVEGHPQLPIALVPPAPPYTTTLREAIREVADGAVTSGQLPANPAVEILRRRPPRTTRGELVRTGDDRTDLVANLREMECSYLAVQGPPGTGKTFTGSRVIRDLVAEHGWRIGVVAQSHAVVENMLGSIVSAGLDGSRVGKKDSRDRNRTWQDVKDQASFLAQNEDGCVLGGTAWTFTGRQVGRDSLDLIVVDEAGQFSLADTVAVSVAAPRLLLLGDPQQLPQVSQGMHSEPIDESALSWLMDGHQAMPPELGIFLAMTYRMHPEVCRPVSQLSYEGRLTSAPNTSQRELVDEAPGIRVVEVEHAGNSTASPEEATVVVDQARAVLGTTWRDPQAARPERSLGQDDVLVVTPYNAQRLLIRRALDAAGLDRVRVGTVDKFQGQQAPVVIVSMTASSSAEVPRGMAFLINRNRINVAVSRAQWRAVVVRSPHLTSYMPATVHGLLELGAFVGLCEAGT